MKANRVVSQEEGLAADEGLEVVTTRVIDAPRELVFKAWIDPKHMARWWGPHGFTTPVCELDVRVGGVGRIVMRGPDGAEHPMKAVFREDVENERLVFSNVPVDEAGAPLLDGETIVTFAEQGRKTKLTVQTRAVALDERAKPMLKGMEAGWAQTIERLATYLENARRD